jgi:hypothetical protein
MPTTRLSSEETVRRGKAIYEERIREQVEPAHKGEYLVINVETGEYEMDQEHIAAWNRAAEKHPGASLFGMRVGYPTVGRIGASSLRSHD